VDWDERTSGNPPMTFPIKKRISTELFIARTAAHYIGEIWTRVASDGGDQLAGTNCLEERAYFAQKCFLDTKRCEPILN